MHIPPLFSSPLLHNTVSQLSRTHYSQLLSHFQHAQRALSYYLDAAIPRGSTICAIAPGPLLATLLPSLAEEKNARVIILGPHKHGFEHVLSNEHPNNADLYLVEPAGLTTQGGLCTPEHSALAATYPCTGIASILQWTPQTPASYDFVPLKNVITELGNHNIEHFDELTSASSWQTSSLLS